MVSVNTTARHNSTSQCMYNGVNMEHTFALRTREHAWLVNSIWLSGNNVATNALICSIISCTGQSWIGLLSWVYRPHCTVILSRSVNGDSLKKIPYFYPSLTSWRCESTLQCIPCQAGWNRICAGLRAFTYCMGTARGVVPEMPTNPKWWWARDDGAGGDRGTSGDGSSYWQDTVCSIGVY